MNTYNAIPDPRLATYCCNLQATRNLPQPWTFQNACCEINGRVAIERRFAPIEQKYYRQMVRRT